MPDIYVAGTPKKGKRRFKEYSAVMAEAQPTENPLAAFMVRPKKLRFATQESEEAVLLLLRKHWITNVPWILLVVGMVIAPAFSSVILPNLGWLPARFEFMAVVLWYLLTLAVVVENFLDWYFNVYIVTDERIVDIDFYSLIYKKISDMQIYRIQDITVTQGGVVRALFDFGTVLIQTAGETEEFDFVDVPHPELVSKFLNEMLAEEENELMNRRE